MPEFDKSINENGFNIGSTMHMSNLKEIKEQEQQDENGNNANEEVESESQVQEY